MTSPANFSTPYRIVTNAYQDAGLVRAGTNLNSDQLANGMMRLTDLINMWQTTGLKLWTQVDQSITLVAGQQTYTFGPSGTINMAKPLRALQGYYLDSTGDNRRPIYPLAWNDWLNLSIITSQGQINSYFVDKQLSLLSVKFWLIPDAEAATGTAHLLLQQQVTNFTGLTDTIDFPVEWLMALRWGLADDLSTGQPDSIQQKCKGNATMYRSALDDWDVEDAPTSFQPDMRLGQGYGKFR